MRLDWKAAPLLLCLLVPLGVTSTPEDSRFSVAPTTRLEQRPGSNPLRAELSRTAADAVHLSAGDATTTFALRGASRVAGVERSGYVVYPGALSGADALQRLGDGSVEDYVSFASRPEREELVYAVDVSRVAGLRLVANTLELLDAGGAPRLRITPPSFVDAVSVKSAQLDVDDCAVDTDPSSPWGRLPIPPGRASCSVRVSWHSEDYPAIVDPQWTVTGSMISRRVSHTATFLTGGAAAGKVLVVGGLDAQPGGGQGYRSAELYDPATGTFAATGMMLVARFNHTATLLAGNDKLLVTGGEPGMSGSAVSSAEVYDSTTGLFTATVGPMHIARTMHAAALLGSGKVLVVGGADTSAETYDPAAQTFSLVGPTAQLRSGSTATVLTKGIHSGDVLVVGGKDPNQTESEPFASTDRYVVGTSTFTSGPPLVVGRTEHTATTLVDGRIFIAGGLDGLGSGTGEIYDFTTDSFGAHTLAGGGSGTGHSAALLTVGPDAGKVLLVGGGADAALFDPVTGSSSATGSMNFTRTGPVATTLITGPKAGKVLVTGGTYFDIGDDTIARLESELYTPLGTSCAADVDCAGSGPCVDGVCCATSCVGQCQACDVIGKEGTCAPVTGAPHGSRVSCVSTSDVSCGASACDGTNELACDFVAAKTTCGSSCANGEGADRSCDGKGSCVSGAPQRCADNLACDDITSACRTGCTVDADCTSGFACDSSGKCSIATTCSPADDHTAVSATGVAKDCAPYRCGGAGSCLLSCVSVADCTAPNGCDATGKCVAPTDDGGGCNDSGGAVSSWSLVALALFGIIAARRRRTSVPA